MYHQTKLNSAWETTNLIGRDDASADGPSVVTAAAALACYISWTARQAVGVE